MKIVLLLVFRIFVKFLNEMIGNAVSKDGRILLQLGWALRDNINALIKNMLEK